MYTKEDRDKKDFAEPAREKRKPPSKVVEDAAMTKLAAEILGGLSDELKQLTVEGPEPIGNAPTDTSKLPPDSVVRILCVRKENVCDEVLIPGTAEEPCHECGNTVVISPASMELHKLHPKGELVCNECAMPKVVEAALSGKSIERAVLTDKQIQELRDAGVAENHIEFFCTKATPLDVIALMYLVDKHPNTLARMVGSFMKQRKAE